MLSESNSHQLRRVAIDAVQPSARSLRRHPAKQLRKVRESLKRFGQVKPIVVGPSGEVLDGELLLQALRNNGATHVDVVVVNDLSAAEMLTLRLSLNRTALDAQWELSNLPLVLDQLVEADIDLRLTGFDPAELEVHFSLDNEDRTIRSAATERFSPVAAPPVCRVGDVWRMDDHVLAVGPLDDANLIRPLLDGRRASVTLLDVMPTGTSSDEAFKASRDVFQAVQTYSAPDSCLFAFADWRYLLETLLAGRATNMCLATIAVWSKNTSTANTGLYSDEHELVAVFSQLPSSAEQFCLRRKRGNVWSYARPDLSQQPESDGVDRSLKPWILIRAILQDVTERGAVVLDLGVGCPALIAAQKMRRHYWGIEPDPSLADLSIRSWQRLTRRRAVLVATGEKFDDRARAAGTVLCIEDKHDV
jgi:hypothetical protein